MKNLIFNILILFLFTSNINYLYSEVNTLPAKLEMNHNEAMYCYYQGKLYLFGGKSIGQGIRNSCLILDISNPIKWESGPDMPIRRVGGTACLINDKIYLIGGVKAINFGGNPTTYEFASEVVEFDPKSNKYTLKSDMTIPGYSTPAISFGNYIIVLGGHLKEINSDNTISASSQIQIYNVETDEWTLSGNAPFEPDYSTATILGNEIYFLGNRDKQSPWAYKGKFDTKTLNIDDWTPIADPMNRLFAMATGVLNGEIYVAGGAIDKSGGPANLDITKYLTNTNTWAVIDTMPIDFMAAFFVPVMPSDGKNLYLIGGTGSQSTYKISFETSNIKDRLDFESTVISNDKISLVSKTNNLLTFNLVDLNGRNYNVEYQREAMNKYNIDISNLTSGFYLLTVNIMNKTAIIKIIKE